MLIWVCWVYVCICTVLCVSACVILYQTAVFFLVCFFSKCVCVFNCLHVSEVNVNRPVCLPLGFFLQLHPVYREPVSLHHSFIAFSSAASIAHSFSSFTSHLCGTLCTFVCPVLPVRFISLAHLLPIDPFLFLPSLNLLHSHALSISCDLSGLQSCVMRDRRGRLCSVTLICCG